MRYVLRKTSDFKAKIKVRRKSTDDSIPRARSGVTTRSSCSGSLLASSISSASFTKSTPIHPLEFDHTPDLTYHSSGHLNKRNFTILVEVKGIDSIASLKTAQMQLISFAVALSCSDLVNQGTKQFILLAILPKRFHVATFLPKNQKNGNVYFQMFEVFTPSGNLNMANFLSFLAALDTALAKFVM